jgi:ABC-2 type transport system permease protein
VPGGYRTVAYTSAHDLPDHLILIGLGMLLIGAVMLVIAQLIFTRFENKIPERL